MHHLSRHSWRRCLFSAPALPTACLAAALLWLAAPAWAQVPTPSGEPRAEPQQPKSRAAIAISGLSAEDVQARFGKPDGEHKDASGKRESWSYGQSTVFLADGRVTGWSDRGELSERESMQLLKSKKPEEGDPFEKDWENPWTPRDTTKKPDVLPELIK